MSVLFCMLCGLAFPTAVDTTRTAAAQRSKVQEDVLQFSKEQVRVTQAKGARVPVVRTGTAQNKTAQRLAIGASNRSMIARSRSGVIYTYRSSNEKVASVSANGVVVGKRKGKASVIRYRTKNHKTRIDKVQAYKIVPLAINGKKTVYVNGKYQYKAAGATVRWKVSSRKRAVVTKKGMLRAKKAGKITLSAKTGSRTVKRKLTIKKDTIKGLSVRYTGNTAYQGNTIQKKDYVVKAVYQSGKKKTVSNYQFDRSQYSAVGKEKITVRYGKYKKKVSVSVAKKEVTSLQVEYHGRALAVGQSVNANDLAVTAVYNDGSTKTLTTSEFALGNAQAKEKGNLRVVVTHIASGVQAVVNISANALSVAGVEASYAGGVIYAGDDVETSKIKLVVTYEDGSKALVDASNIRVASTTTEDGKVKMMLYYTVDGVEYSTVLSVEEKSHKPIELIVESDRPYVFCNKELNRKNFLVKVRYSDGEEKITEEWISDYQVSDAEGEKTVVFQYTEDAITLSQSLTVTVKQSNPIGIKVLKGISQVKEGGSLDLSQMEVAAVYEDGYEETVTGFQTDYDSSNLTAGERIVTVRYGEFTTEMKLTVEARKVLSISATDPTGITLTGSELNTTGMSVTAYYDNDTSQVVSGWTTSYSAQLPAGHHAITVSYGGAECIVGVQVEEALTITATSGSEIVGHPVTVTANQSDVEYSVVGGSANLIRQSGQAVSVRSTAPGTVTVQAQRSKTGEVKQVAIQCTAFSMSYHNSAGGNAAQGDRLIFTVNASAQFEFRLDGTDGKTYTGSKTGLTTYDYNATRTGVLTMTATDSVSGARLERTVTIRKPLEISGASTVKVGNSITLTTTKQVVSWSTSNSAVATINQSGVVKGKKAGTVTITATFPEYGNRTVTKKITVKKKAS